MTIKLTKEALEAMNPCAASQRLALFGKRKSMTAKQALEAGATISDLLWVAGRMGLGRQCVEYALACAQRTAHFNTDPRVQGALDATQAWLDAPSDAAGRAAGRAADAAGRAAGRAADAVAYAADAAAYAADAAAYAADAVAYAAYAADAAAYAAGRAAGRAADAAAYAAEEQAQQALFLKIFK